MWVDNERIEIRVGSGRNKREIKFENKKFEMRSEKHLQTHVVRVRGAGISFMSHNVYFATYILPLTVISVYHLNRGVFS